QGGGAASVTGGRTGPSRKAASAQAAGDGVVREAVVRLVLRHVGAVERDGGGFVDEDAAAFGGAAGGDVLGHRPAVEGHVAVEHGGDAAALADALLGFGPVLGEGGGGEGRRAGPERAFGVAQAAAEGGAAGGDHRDRGVAGEGVGRAGQHGALAETEVVRVDPAGAVEEPAADGDVDGGAVGFGAVAAHRGAGHRHAGGRLIAAEEGAAAAAGQAGRAAGEAAHRVVADLVVVEDRVARGEGVDGDAGAGGDGLEVAVNLGRVVPHGGVLHGEGAVGGDAPAFDHRRALAQRGADGDGLVVVDRAVAVERHGALVLDA